MRGPAFIQLTEAGHDGWPFLVNVEHIVTVQRRPRNVMETGATDVEVFVGDRVRTYNVVETMAEVSAKLIALAINDA